MGLLPYNPSSLGIGGVLLTIAKALATGLPNAAAITAEADDEIVTFTGGAHNLQTGDKVVPTFASGFTGLTSGTTYYAIYVSATTIKLAATLAGAFANTAINITADGVTGTMSYVGQSYRALNWEPDAQTREVGRTDENGDDAEFTLRAVPERQTGLQLQLATAQTPRPRCGMEFDDPDDATKTYVVTGRSKKKRAGEIHYCEISYRSLTNQTD